MVKSLESSFSHDHPFSAVALAYFLRYPNPYASHVQSTDVVESHFDPDTQRLYTARLHLKRSKVPTTLLRLLPRSIIGESTAVNGADTSQSYILERSMVDVRNGVMITESSNLEFKGVLVVIEKQVYHRPSLNLAAFLRSFAPVPGFRIAYPDSAVSILPSIERSDTSTNVFTKVECLSNLGGVRSRLPQSRPQPIKSAGDGLGGSVESGANTPDMQEVPAQKVGFFRAWGASSVQRTIESIGLRRAERAVPNSEKGMNVVLDRLRRGGLVGVLEGMKHDRENPAEIA